MTIDERTEGSGAGKICGVYQTIKSTNNSCLVCDPYWGTSTACLYYRKHSGISGLSSHSTTQYSTSSIALMAFGHVDNMVFNVPLAGVSVCLVKHGTMLRVHAFILIYTPEYNYCLRTWLKSSGKILTFLHTGSKL